MTEQSIDPLRSAMKFSLWTWAAYWPGAGILLLVGGMTDPTSIVVALLATAGFLLVLASGALRSEATDRKTAARWLLERPIYLLVLLVVLLAAGSFVQSAANIGFFVFSGLYFAGLVLCIVRLHQHVRRSRVGTFASGADQTYLLLGLMAVLAGIVFLDTFIGAGVGVPASVGALFNWIQLLYPPLLLVAARPFREQLQLPLAAWVGGKLKVKAEPEATA